MNDTVFLTGTKPWPKVHVTSGGEYTFCCETDDGATYTLTRVPCSICGQMTVSLDTKVCHDCDTVRSHLVNYMKGDKERQFVQTCLLESYQKSMAIMEERIRCVKSNTLVQAR
jgi:hypothetical protein